VWTADSARGAAVARRVRAGWMTVTGAEVSMQGSFGGYKASGIGREFGAVGLGQYVEYKTIAV